jgi:hypothetical protein
MQGKPAFLPGEICHQAGDGNPGREAKLRWQKSAEAIVPPPSRWEGLNIKEARNFEQFVGRTQKADFPG